MVWVFFLFMFLLPTISIVSYPTNGDSLHTLIVLYGVLYSSSQWIMVRGVFAFSFAAYSSCVDCVGCGVDLFQPGTDMTVRITVPCMHVRTCRRVSLFNVTRILMRCSIYVCVCLAVWTTPIALLDLHFG